MAQSQFWLVSRPLGIYHSLSTSKFAPSCFGMCLTATVLLSCLPSRVHAQPIFGARGARSRATQVDVFLPAPRELRRELSQAKEDLQNKRYVDAITRLDLILSGGNADNGEFAEDYFLPKQGTGSFQSLKAEALRIVSELDTEGQKAYELQFGTDARQQLEQAIASRDTEALVRISRRYGSTRAGQEATMLLGRDRLQRGRPLEAVLHLQRLANSQIASARFGGELEILLATALLLSDRQSEAVERLLAFRAKHPDAQITVRGEVVPWLGEDVDAVEWLTRQTGSLDESIREVLSQWLVFGGNSQRSGVGDADMPLRSIRWDVDFALRLDEASTIDRQAKSLSGQGATPALHPLAVNGWILMRSADLLLGVEAETGRRVWIYPWANEFESSGALLGDPYGAGGARRTSLLKGRVWEDALYGQLSSDGEAVFLLNKLNGDYNMGAGGLPVTNELVALELKRQGYSLWMVGGEDGRDNPELAGAFFLGPPLPIGDQLYCIVEMNGEIRLVVLDKADGSLSWSQQLAHVDQRARLSHGGVRRKAGVSSSHADGILVCPTSVGGVVAVDLAGRAFLWGFRYQPSAISRSRQAGFSLRWRDNWSTIAQGKVILTPFDSNNIYCLDLLTGESVWSGPKSRGSNLYVAGVHGDQIVLVGKDTVSTMNINTGGNGWSLALRGNPAGRGVQSGSHYLLATTTPELIKIDLDTGKIVESIATDEPLGNLVAYQDQIVAQNHKKLRAFYQRDKLMQRVDDTLAEDANDPWALEHRALLLLDAGQRVEGLKVLRQAIAAYPNDDSGNDLGAKELLVKTSLEMLRDNVPGATGLAKEIEPLIAKLPDKRNEFLRVMAVNLQREGELGEAFVKNLDLFESKRSGSGSISLSGDVELMPVGKHRRIRHDRWHRAMFRDLWREADEVQREQLAATVESALGKATPAELARLVAVLQDIPAARQAQIQVLREQLASRAVTPITESLLHRLSKVDDEVVARQATASLARLYRSAGRYAAAVAQYRILDTNYRDQPVSGEMTGAAFVEAESEGNETVLSYIRAEQAWPYGRIDAMTDDTTVPPKRVGSMPASRPFDALTQLYPISTERPFSWGPHGLNIVYDQSRHVFQGRDGMGQVHPLASLGAAFPRVRARDLSVLTNGHLIVAAKDSALVAINGLASDPDNSIMWKESGGSATPYTRSSRGTRTIRFGETGLSRTMQSGAGGKSVISLGAVSDRGLVMRRYGELLCLDPADGETIWVRNDISLDADVWGDDEYVFVHVPGEEPGSDANARVFSVMDGRELESRPVADQRHRIRTFGRHVLSWTYDVRGKVDEDVEVILQRILKASNTINNIREESLPAEVRKVLVNRIQLNDIFARDKTYEWAHLFEFGAKATFVGEDELAVFEPDAKKFTVFSVGSGELRVEQELDVSLEKIDEVHVEKRAGLYILRLAAYTGGRVGNKMRYRSPNPSVKLQNLQIFAFSRAGEPMWEVPARLRDFMPTMSLAADVPILVFIRRDEDGSPKRTLDTVILDVRDGRAILENTSQYDGQTFHVRGDKDMNQVQVRVPGAKAAWKLQFTDEPRAPSPPYGHSTAVSRTAGGLGVVGSLIKAFAAPFRIDGEEEEAPEE